MDNLTFGQILNDSGLGDQTINLPDINNVTGDPTINIFTNTIACFGEDTEILTNNGYILIKNLRKGDLVKTTYNDYVPINMIGVSQIYNAGDDKRIRDRLYKYTSNEYPQITKDLFLTDRKYRLPACVDAKSKPYDKKGRFDIYHIALENDYYYGNYGVYANGLLVESCSKRYLKELSNMKLL